MLFAPFVCLQKWRVRFRRWAMAGEILFPFHIIMATIMKMLIATKDDKLRLALAFLFAQEPGATIIGSTDTLAGLLALAKTASVDVVLMDILLLKEATPKLVDTVNESLGCTKIILLVDDFNEAYRYSFSAIVGSVSKNDAPQEILQVLNQFYQQAGKNVGNTPS